jgi:DNA-binding transcriptional ArsR family regulator
VTDVFRALADPTRRAVLDALFEQDGQTVSDLSERFPEMSRFGVMKHIRVLEQADLVVRVQQGRVTRHFLNAVPIEQIANRWISRYSGRFTSALVELDHEVRRNAAQNETKE